MPLADCGALACHEKQILSAFMRVWDETDNSNLNIRTLMRNIHIASVCIFGIKYEYNNK